jgi:hypothetical protein
MTVNKIKVSPAKKRKTRVPIAPAVALKHFALQVLLDSKLSFDDCTVVVETIRGVKTNLYSFDNDVIVEDLMIRLKDLIGSFEGRRGRMKVAYVTLASMKGAEQMQVVATALASALNSKEFRKAKVKEQRELKAALSNLNQEVLLDTQYSKFRPLRNKGTAKEYRPRDRNQFDRPKSLRKPRLFQPLVMPRGPNAILPKDPNAKPKKPTLDPYKEADIIVPSDLSAWQLRLLINALS